MSTLHTTPAHVPWIRTHVAATAMIALAVVVAAVLAVILLWPASTATPAGTGSTVTLPHRFAEPQ